MRRMSEWRINSRLVLMGFLLLALAASSAWAETGATTVESRLAALEARANAASGIDNGDNAWLLVSSALVLMMSAPGLILFYGGLVRQKNVLGTMMHSLVLMGVVSVLWVLFGYSMAFGQGNAFCGNPFQHFLLRGQIVKACVVLRPGVEPADELKRELQARCKRLIAAYKYPREDELVRELPKTTSGKTRHVQLRQVAPD